jgi:hypothetical protein
VAEGLIIPATREKELPIESSVMPMLNEARTPGPSMNGPAVAEKVVLSRCGGPLEPGAADSPHRNSYNPGTSSRKRGNAFRHKAVRVQCMRVGSDEDPSARGELLGSEIHPG